MGPWVHGGWARGDGSALGNIQFGSATSKYYQTNIEIPFFEQHLNNNKTKELPEASIFYTGENKWKEHTQWPPSNMIATKFYFQPNNKLSEKESTKNVLLAEYISDPAKPVPYTEDVHTNRTREYMCDDQRFAARRPDVVVFETEILENDVTIAGQLEANLLVQLNSTDADFVVKLIDVFPENFAYPKNDSNYQQNNYVMGGYQMLVRGEIMRGKFRKSFSNPTAFKPNKTEEVAFHLPDVAHTFKKGHKIMVQVQSSWFPLMDRNPQQYMNIYTAEDKDFKKATIKIMAGSYVQLPVIK
jgi:hypothetical protein